MDKIGSGSVEDLLKYPPPTWTSAFFLFTCKSDVVDNNMCEAFNGKILEVRSKHIISMLEDIRVYIMNRITKKRE